MNILFEKIYNQVSREDVIENGIEKIIQCDNCGKKFDLYKEGNIVIEDYHAILLCDDCNECVGCGGKFENREEVEFCDGFYHHECF